MTEQGRPADEGPAGGNMPTTTTPLTRTVIAGVAGGLAFIVGNVLTFGLLGGSQRGRQGLLFDPDTQHPKVITVWKVLEPLPRVIETPACILTGLLIFGIGYAFLYQSIATAWPRGLHRHALRLAVIVWLAAAFAEFMGPFNVLHEPVPLAALSLGFWALSALAEAYVLVRVARCY
ncbi:hypothetical protein Dvina_40950 [Dactylosporangium vinaceum]|uniref:Integral membrane protein n=1 Tax=Dactylosporangium vinaceum TaxID=53362 RepID=A0ABV5M3Q9_9ACTN|nr:hypothetical protein [Dactylosporangium vinaceum]UAB94455.1 hypothetical protein Dvina_40950 [Dactylosporangium vinaceum]